jgi:hypothetical protein
VRVADLLVFSAFYPRRYVPFVSSKFICLSQRLRVASRIDVAHAACDSLQKVNHPSLLEKDFILYSVLLPKAYHTSRIS